MYHSFKRRAAVAVASLAGFVTLGIAQTDPVMPPVDFPIDTASVATEIAAGGGLILVLVFSTAIGFTLAWKLYRRLKGAV
jgi:hypothetical protein